MPIAQKKLEKINKAMSTIAFSLYQTVSRFSFATEIMSFSIVLSQVVEIVTFFILINRV